MEQSPNNNHQIIALLEQYFFPSESNALSTHKIQIFPLFWKFVTVKLATIVKGDLKAPFSIATTPRCFTLDPYLIMLSVKQGSIKYLFLNLWYDSTWDWTPVSQTIGEHSTYLANDPVYSNFDTCHLKVSILWKLYGFFICGAIYMSGLGLIEGCVN